MDRQVTGQSAAFGQARVFGAGAAEAVSAPAAVPATAAATGARSAGTVRFEGVGKTYRAAAGEVRALDGIDLDIRAGEIFGIIGRSGAGKSSLLRTINRLESPTEGRVLVDGEDVARLDEGGLVGLRRRIGMIFQHFNLLSAKTVRANVGLPLLVAGVPAAEIATRVDEVLALVGLEGKGDSYPGRLSGGQKQRVGIARALISRPEILLCDEATSALDPETTLSILNLLRDINRRLGLTIVLITHEMSVIREICQRVLVLDRGRIAEEGPVWQVFGAPKAEATRALLRPLQQALPEDIAARLGGARRSLRDGTLVELSFAGAGPADLGALAQAAGAGLALVSAAVDRIQGHAVGRILVVVAPDARIENLSALADATRVLGYVHDTDD